VGCRRSGAIIPVVTRAVELPKLYAPFMRVDLTGVNEAEATEAPPPLPPRFRAEPAAPPRGQRRVPIELKSSSRTTAISAGQA
jgi:hypothetical protein